MRRAVFVISPQPKSSLGPEAFALKVMPDPIGIDNNEGTTFANGEVLFKFLSQLKEPYETRVAWARHIGARETFAIRSTYEKWEELVEWAESNL